MCESNLVEISNRNNIYIGFKVQTETDFCVNLATTKKISAQGISEVSLASFPHQNGAERRVLGREINHK